MVSSDFGVFAGGLRFVARTRARASMNRVVVFVSMRPAVMFVCGFGRGLVGCLAKKLGILIEELVCLLEGCDELVVTGLEIVSEGGVCCGESRNGSAITGCSCGEVGYILDCILSGRRWRWRFGNRRRKW